MNDLVSYEVKDGVARIAMDDGRVNVMSVRMLSALNAALDRAAADRAAVLLTGRPGVFSAGFDLPVLRAGGRDAHDMVKQGFETGERLLAFPRPVVVACTGHALAMGVFLVLAGDYRVGAEGAYRIAANEVALGITVPHFGIEMCRQRLVPAHLSRAVLHSEIYAPAGAVTAGFLDRVVPAGELEGAAREAAAALAKLDPAAFEATKARLRGPVLAAVRAAIETDDARRRARA